MAPELFGQKAYSKQVDVYSVGIIMAWMLNKGKHPLFRSDDNEATYKQRVMNPKWRLRNFSNCAKDFFEKMVDPDPTTRFTANLAINHPWITRSEHVDIPLTSVQCIDTYDT
jgi:serine/threonine protein kinase